MAKRDTDISAQNSLTNVGDIEKLKKQLTSERHSLHQARVNYSAELRARTEMERILRSGLSDIQAEIAKQ